MQWFYCWKWDLLLLLLPPPPWQNSPRSGLGLLIMRFLDCAQDSLVEWSTHHKATSPLPYTPFLTFHDPPTRVLWQLYQSRHLVAKHGDWARNMATQFCLQSISFALCSVLLHALNLQHGTDCFTSPPKEVVLRILLALKNPLPLGQVRTHERFFK
jgi:hypothetical protein